MCSCLPAFPKTLWDILAMICANNGARPICPDIAGVHLDPFERDWEMLNHVDPLNIYFDITSYEGHAAKQRAQDQWSGALMLWESMNKPTDI